MKWRLSIMGLTMAVIVTLVVLVVKDVTVVSVTTADRYYLSPRQVKVLSEKANIQNDGDGAFKLALYYERNRDDLSQSIKWRKKAASLGNESAKRWLDRNVELVDSVERKDEPAKPRQ